MSALSALWLMAKMLPVPVTPLGGFTSPFTGSIGASSTFASVTRTACTPKASGNVHPVSSYGRACASVGDQYW